MYELVIDWEHGNPSKQTLSFTTREKANEAEKGFLASFGGHIKRTRVREVKDYDVIFTVVHQYSFPKRTESAKEAVEALKKWWNSDASNLGRLEMVGESFEEVACVTVLNENPDGEPYWEEANEEW